MPTNLNPGYTNNINTIQIRTAGNKSQRVTDRPIDVTGDGNEEQVTITHVSGEAVGTPSAPGGVTRSTVTIPAGSARTVIAETTEQDGGVHTDSDVTENTEGVS